jgi:hypothetical protein
MVTKSVTGSCTSQQGSSNIPSILGGEVTKRGFIFFPSTSSVALDMELIEIKTQSIKNRAPIVLFFKIPPLLIDEYLPVQVHSHFSGVSAKKLNNPLNPPCQGDFFISSLISKIRRKGGSGWVRGSVGFSQRLIRLWRKSPNECWSSSLHSSHDLMVMAIGRGNKSWIFGIHNLPRALARGSCMTLPLSPSPHLWRGGAKGGEVKKPLVGDHTVASLSAKVRVVPTNYVKAKLNCAFLFRERLIKKAAVP